VDVEAWIEAHPRKVNPLEQLKNLHEQFQQVLQRIGGLETQFDTFRTSTRGQLAALKEEVQRDDLQQALNHLTIMLDQFPVQAYLFSKPQPYENGDMSPFSRVRIDLQERVPVHFRLLNDVSFQTEQWRSLPSQKSTK
jgi:hypothetical protein